MMKSLQEVKDALKEEIRAYKPLIKELRKEESSGVSEGGFSLHSSKYEMMRELEVHTATLERVYKYLTKIRRLK